jgi:hypothetical protein
MPGYPGRGLAKLLYDNQQIYLFQNEIVAAGQRSIAMALSKQTGKHHGVDGFSVEASFAGAPGTFELDVQVADTDDPLFYVTLGSITVVNPTNVGRFVQVGIPGKYVCVQVNSLANAVGLMVKLTR